MHCIYWIYTYVLSMFFPTKYVIVVLIYLTILNIYFPCELLWRDFICLFINNLNIALWNRVIREVTYKENYFFWSVQFFIDVSLSGLLIFVFDCIKQSFGLWLPSSSPRFEFLSLWCVAITGRVYLTRSKRGSFNAYLTVIDNRFTTSRHPISTLQITTKYIVLQWYWN